MTKYVNKKIFTAIFVSKQLSFNLLSKFPNNIKRYFRSKFPNNIKRYFSFNNINR